jgi:hypothetical protein
MATSTTPEELLSQLGISVVSVGREIAARCPFHTDSHPSFSMNASTGLWICLAGETKVWTWDGLVPIKELAGTTPRILSSRGWVDAPIKDFGVQRLYKIELSRTGKRKTIYATREHRWFVRGSGGKKVARTTGELRTSDRLWHRAFPVQNAGVLSPWGVAHGITFGDGWLQQGHRAASVTLWGDKDRELLKFFPLSPTCADSNPESSVTGVRVMNLPKAWKDYPDLNESPSYLLGWLAGYFAADGSVSELGHVRLNSADRKALEFVQLLCARIGITTFEIGSQNRVGKGKHPTSLYFLDFVRSSVPQDFYLLAVHRLRAQREFKYERLRWQVVSVEETNRVESVYCAVVDETHDFVLEGNILTGNCYQCGESGTMQDLVYKVSGDSSNVKDMLREVKLRKLKKKKEFEEKPEPEEVLSPYMLEALLATYERPPDWALMDRSLKLHSVETYDLRWDKGWIIPIHSPEGELWGWQFKRMKVVSNYPPGIKKSQTLFGLAQLTGSTVVLVESPLDVVRLHDQGVCAVASFGAFVSKKQIQLLKENADRVVLALDNDEEGWRQTDKIFLGLKRSLPTMKAVYPAKDPGDLSNRQIARAFGDVQRNPLRLSKGSGRDDARPSESASRS